MLYDMIKLSMGRLIASENELNDLDKESGDGDCGSTLARGAKGQCRVKVGRGGVMLLPQRCPMIFKTMKKLKKNNIKTNCLFVILLFYP